MDYNSTNLPPACDGVDPCTDVACQRAIAQMHLISEEDFLSRIISSAGAPKVLSAGQMQQVLNGGTCAADKIVLNQNAPTNAALNPVAQPDAAGQVAYSYPCFNGILADNPVSFSFYLATGDYSGKDVIFKANFSGGRTQYYDGSSQWP